MKNFFTRLFTRPLAVLAALAIATQVLSQPPMAAVVSVGDGDTIRARTGSEVVTVRLACIDAPELAQQPWGDRAKARLQQLLPIGQTVALRIVDTDWYGRKVAEIFKDNRSINLQLVAEGHAVIYRQYFGGCNATRTQYLEAETQAKQARSNFWSQSNPVMPWDFRHGELPRNTPGSLPTQTPVRTPAIGSCQCPYDLDRRGNACGNRSTYSRSGNVSCYRQ